MGQSLASRVRTKDSPWPRRPTGWGWAVRKAPQRPGCPEASAGELGGWENGRGSLGRSGAGRCRPGRPLWPLTPVEGSGSQGQVRGQTHPRVHTHPRSEAGIPSLSPGLSGTQRWVFASIGEANSCEQTSGHAGQVGVFSHHCALLLGGGPASRPGLQARPCDMLRPRGRDCTCLRPRGWS